ncbi:MAG: phosphoribosylglycinamide synthetase C domain-containing protein, partial [Candidatus Marinimicrobia bacterium]|nr:phosphoribosylglycinamide synthetase C domain-containing protein [Candidatus Neomarinimicrobiota bacterium]
GLFYASVDFKGTSLVEAGSRTIAIVGIADTISDAEALAEKEVSSISGPLFHRTDIGTDEIVQKRVDHMNSLR